MRRLIFAAAVPFLLLLGTGTAHAEDLVGNARFDSPGVRVFDDGAVGVGCTTFGFCDGVTFAVLNHSSITRQRSDRAGEPVVVDCRVNDLFRVQTFDTTGWASAHSVSPAGAVSTC
jgi:hypothetical protein